MNKKHKEISALLQDYLDGKLEGKQRAHVEHHLEECISCSRELEELRVLFQVMASGEEKELPTRIRSRFLEQLEEEKARVGMETPPASLILPSKEGNRYAFLKVAAVLALLVGAYLIGRFQQGTGPVPDTMVDRNAPDTTGNTFLARFESVSASKRIQAVQEATDEQEAEDQILRAVADRMLYDPQPNVRLAAVEALETFTESELVRRSYITALKTEEDPGIQIMIIRILVKIREKEAAGPLRKMLESQDTQPFVKEQIKSLLPAIT